MTAIFSLLSFSKDAWKYVRRIQQFKKEDWIYYIQWVGLMVGLLACTLGFVCIGWVHGVEFPAYVWNIPLGTLIFVIAIAIDTIGHQTVYKQALENGERLVHLITIFSGIFSCIVLCLGYRWPVFMRLPAAVLIVLSVFYSVIDEWMHWKRYMNGSSDRIEMWSHYFIFLGHLIMVVSWWVWFEAGYPGVRETLDVFLRH
jgi:hypothetical protein